MSETLEWETGRDIGEEEEASSVEEVVIGEDEYDKVLFPMVMDDDKDDEDFSVDMDSECNSISAASNSSCCSNDWEEYNAKRIKEVAANAAATFACCHS